MTVTTNTPTRRSPFAAENTPGHRPEQPAKRPKVSAPEPPPVGKSKGGLITGEYSLFWRRELRAAINAQQITRQRLEEARRETGWALLLLRNGKTEEAIRALEEIQKSAP